MYTTWKRRRRKRKDVKEEDPVENDPCPKTGQVDRICRRKGLFFKNLVFTN
jgi:hypothetical protein